MKKKKIRRRYAKALYTPATPFYLAKQYFRNVGKVISLPPEENINLKTVDEIRNALKVKKTILERIENLRKRRKVKNGLISESKRSTYGLE